MPKKDVCYITTNALEPKYLKGQIITIKEPQSDWSEIERGNKIPGDSDIRLAVKTLVVSKVKLNSVTENRLVIIKKNGRDFVDLKPKYNPPEKD